MFIFKRIINLLLLICIGCSQRVEPLTQEKPHKELTAELTENHANDDRAVEQAFLDEQIVLYAGIDDTRDLIDNLSLLYPKFIKQFEVLDKFYKGQFKTALYASQSIRLFMIKKEKAPEKKRDTIDHFARKPNIFNDYEVIFTLSFEGNQSFFKAIKEDHIVNIYEKRNFYLQKKGKLFVVSSHPNILLKYTDTILGLHQLTVPKMEHLKLYLNPKALTQSINQLKNKIANIKTQYFQKKIKLLLDHADEIISILFTLDIQLSTIRVINHITLKENSRLLSELNLTEDILKTNVMHFLKQPAHFLFFLTGLQDVKELLINQLNQQRIHMNQYQAVLNASSSKNLLLYASKYQEILGIDLHASSDFSQNQPSLEHTQPKVFLDFLDKIKGEKVFFAFLIDQFFFQSDMPADFSLSIFSMLKKEHLISQLDLSVGGLDFLIAIKEKDKELQKEIDGLILKADDFDKQKNFKEARMLLAKALELHQQLVNDPDQTLDDQEIILNNRLGLVLVKLENYAEAESLYRKNLEIHTIDAPLDRYVMYANLAWSLLLQGKSKEALVYAQKSIDPMLSDKTWNYHWRKLMIHLCKVLESKRKTNIETLEKSREFKRLSEILEPDNEYTLMAKKRMMRVLELKENQK